MTIESVHLTLVALALTHLGAAATYGAASIEGLITETAGGKTTPKSSKVSGTPKAEIFISPTGNDANAGTAQAPLKTFARALAKVEMLPPDWSSDVVVFVEPGDYELQSTIRLGAEHSGKNGKKLIFKANGKPGSAVLIAGQRLDPSKWQEYRDGIYVQDLEDVESVQIIYENRNRSRKARIPNHRYLQDFPVADGDYFHSQKNGMGAPWIVPRESDIDDALLSHIEQDLANDIKHYLVIFGSGNRDWHKYVAPISGINSEERRIFLSEPSPRLHKNEDDDNSRYYIEGGLRFLDAKGEFYFDEKERRLYYRPHNDIRESEIVYSTVKNIFRIDGAKNVVIDGLTLTCSGVLEYTDPAYTWSDPHAAISIKDSHFVSIINCHFYSIGQSAINLERSHSNTVRNCLLEYLGQSGIKLEFSDNNEIRDCLIHDIGLRRLYCEGVAVHSSRDNTVRHLEIFNSARYGITLRARVDKNTGQSGAPTTGNVVEYVKMYNLNQDSGDTAGLHMAMINYPAGPNYTNTCNQITIHRSIAQPDITDEWKPTGVYLDHPKAVMNQSLNNIEVTEYDPRYPGYDPKRFNGIYGPEPRTNALERQIYQNRPHNNASSTKFNCSWSPDFDKQHMEYDKIGLTHEFPAEYRRDWMCSRLKEAQGHGKQEVVMQRATSYTVVTEIPQKGRHWINTPGIVVLPGSDYLATVPVGTRKDMQHGWMSRFLRSDDGGESWAVVSEGPYSDVIPFIANGVLYAFVQAHMVPDCLGIGDIVLVRSDDGGSTWTDPVTLFAGRYWNAPTTPVIRGGHIYFAFNETCWNDERAGLVVIKGDLGADLLKPVSWQMSNVVPFPGVPEELSSNSMASHKKDWKGWPHSAWLEPNVVDVNGHIKVLARVVIDGYATPNIASVCDLSEANGSLTLSFRQFAALPGGQCKFFIKHDAQSRLFWMASNIPTDAQEQVHDWERIRAEKAFLSGPGNERRILMLWYSVDALSWFSAGCIAMTTSPHQSFMYPSFDIDGDDIVLISRSSINARDQHDADTATFHRVERFRSLAMNLFPEL